MRRTTRLAALLALACTACGAPEAVQVGTGALPTARVELTARSSGPIVPQPPTHPATPTARPAEPPTAPPTSQTTALALDAAPTGPPAPTDDAATREALLIAEINRVRAANTLPPYQASPELSAAARAHSCDLAAHHVISHVSSDGRTLTERLAGFTPAWEWPSESIAVGYDDPAQVVAVWMDEPPEGWHRRNILDTQQQAVGAGYCYSSDDPSGNGFYWTADFARRTAQ